MTSKHTDGKLYPFSDHSYGQASIVDTWNGKIIASVEVHRGGQLQFNHTEIHDSWKSFVNDFMEGRIISLPSVYVHIPYCESRCKYCRYDSEELNDEEYLAAYLRRLLDEIFVMSQYTEGLEFNSLYIGGGTPSIYDADDLGKIVSAVFDSFSISKNGINTCEMNPRSSTERKIEAISRKGINRISFGVQSATQEVLERVGRPFVPIEIIKNLIDVAKRNSITEVNIDLLTPLPNETAESFRSSINKIAECNPDTITLYKYIPSPESMRKLVFTAENNMSCWSAIRDIFLEECQNHGYMVLNEFSKLMNISLAVRDQNGISQKNRYTLYSEWPTAVLGIGKKAISNISYKMTCQNNGPKYPEDPKSPDIYVGEYRNSYDEACRAIGFHMKRRWPLSRTEFKRYFGADPIDMFNERFNLLNRKGLINITPDFIYWKFEFQDEVQFNRFNKLFFNNTYIP